MADGDNDPVRVEKIFGAHRIEYEPPMRGASRVEFEAFERHEEADSINMLSRALNVGRVIAFVGSGVSRNYGYAEWRALAKGVVRDAIATWEQEGDDSQDTYMLKQGAKFLDNEPSRTRHSLLKFPVTATEAYKERFRNGYDFPSQFSRKDRAKNALPVSNDSLTLWLGEARRLMDRLDEWQLKEDGHNETQDANHFVGRRFREIVENNNLTQGMGKLVEPLESPIGILVRELGITRFVTTNYDRSIYDELQKIAPDIAGDPIVPTVSDIDKIIDFSTRTGSREGGVMHLHGIERPWLSKQIDGKLCRRPFSERAKWEREPLVVSDRDYQRTYFSNEDEEPLRSFRLALAEMYRANAFLFVGTGLSENEVIRPLRILAAERESHPTPREIFALLEWKDDPVERVDLRNFLYHTYGIRSIFYQVGAKGNVGKAFIRSLRNLAKERNNWWLKWRQTPMIRFPVFGPARDNDTSADRMEIRLQAGGAVPDAGWRTSIHQYQRRPRLASRHALVAPKEFWPGGGTCPYSVKPFWADKPEAENPDNAVWNPKKRVVLVVGSDGTGKRQIESRLIEKLTAPNSEWELISGTTYFSFDFRSFFGYLHDQVVVARQDGKKKDHLHPEDSVTRFRTTLESLQPKQIVLIDGIDHLLTNLREPEAMELGLSDQVAKVLAPLSARDRILIGEPSHHANRRIFEALLDFAKGRIPSRGKVILVGSAVPDLFVKGEETPSAADSTEGGRKAAEIPLMEIVRLRRPSRKEVAGKFSLIRILEAAEADEGYESPHRERLRELLEAIAGYVEGDVYSLAVLDRYMASLLWSATTTWHLPGTEKGGGKPAVWLEFVAETGLDELADLDAYLTSRSRNDRPTRIVEWVLNRVEDRWNYRDSSKTDRARPESEAQIPSPMLASHGAAACDDNCLLRAKVGRARIVLAVNCRMDTLWRQGMTRIDTGKKTLGKDGKEEKIERFHWADVRKIDLRAILLRLSLFWTPASARTLAASFGVPMGEARKDIPNYRDYIALFDEILRELARLNLVFAVRAAPSRSWEIVRDGHTLGSEAPRRYVVHRRVRRAMLRQLGEEPQASRAVRRFVPATYSAEPEPRPTQTVDGYKCAAEAADNLLAHLEKVENWQFSQGETRPFSAPSRNMLRAAYGLLRTSWDAISLPNIQREEAGIFQVDDKRLHLLDGYLSRLSRLANLLNAASRAAQRWRDNNEVERGLILWREGSAAARWDLNGVLYGHELVSLFNELGMASFVHGALNDAYSFFETSLELVNTLNRADEAADLDAAARGAFDTRWAVMHCNLAMVRLERGYLRDALEEFRLVDRVLRGLGPLRSQARNLGWIARLFYFLGRKDEALEIYRVIFGEEKTPQLAAEENEIVRVFQEKKHQLRFNEPVLQPRARAMFLRHRAELHRSHGEYALALRDLNDSVSIAASGDHRDQMHATAVSRVYTEFLVSPEKGSFKQVDPHIAFARRSGLLKMEANFYRVQARIAHRQGYPDVAWRLALQSKEITTYNGVHLDVTSSLIVLGQAAADLIDRGASRRILERALNLAARQHYIQQRTVAEEAIRELETGVRRPSLAFAQLQDIQPQRK